MTRADLLLAEVRRGVGLFIDSLAMIAEHRLDGSAKSHALRAEFHLRMACQEITTAVAAITADDGDQRMWPAPIAPGEYLAQCRSAAGLSIAAVAAQIETSPRLGEIDREQLIRAVESDASAATIHTLAALRAIYPFSIEEVVRLIDATARPAEATATC